MTKKLMRTKEVASALGISMSYLYALSSNDSAFPPIAEKIGPVNFYRPVDVSRYKKVFKLKARMRVQMDFG